MGSNISYPDPSLSIQFDSRSANLTLDGYISARSPNLYGADTKIEAKIKVTFWGVNDASRSDLLKNDSSTPTWIRTIGFGNSTNDIQSLGKNSGSSNRESPSVLSLLASASALFFVSIYI
jgi:type 1 fimbria pilin